MCDVEGFNVSVRRERLIGFEDTVGENFRDKLTPESSLVLAFRFDGIAVGVEDNGTIGKGIKSSVAVSSESFSFRTRRSLNRS